MKYTQPVCRFPASSAKISARKRQTGCVYFIPKESKIFIPTGPNSSQNNTSE
jgi:hypothetical protein